MTGVWNRLRALLTFELVPALKGPLLWAALASLVFLVPLPVRILFLNDFTFNGQVVGQTYRLVYVLAIGYSIIVFLSTLVTLCLCLDRTGAHYLRNNDLLILARSIGRRSFYLAKIGSILAASVAYAFLALLVFWEELYRNAGVNLYQVLILIVPLALSLACLVTLYFLMRNFLGNFMIFFLWMLLLPIIYVGNLWRYYGGVLREGSSHSPIFGMLPQFGGIHAHSLGMIHDFFRRPDTWHSVANLALWTLVGLIAGLAIFTRKRL